MSPEHLNAAAHGILIALLVATWGAVVALRTIVAALNGELRQLRAERFCAARRLDATRIRISRLRRFAAGI